MQRGKLVLLCAVLIANLTVFPAAALTAAAPLSPADPQPAPRECTLKGLLGSSVTIQAGPDPASTGLAPDFPLTDSCPTGFGPGQCKKWVYRWIGNGMQISEALVAVDSDIAVLTASPGAQVAIQLVAEGERFLKFDALKQTTFTGTLWTDLGVGPGTVTAAFIGTKGFGRCNLRGADNLIPEQNQPVDQVVRSELFSEAGQFLCAVDRTVDGFGRTSNIRIVGEGSLCTLVTGLVELRTAGGAALFIDGETQITFPSGSHKYCWASTTTGSMTCVQTPLGHP